MIKLKYLKIFQISLFQAITGSIPLLTTDKELITIRLFITVHGITRSEATHLLEISIAMLQYTYKMFKLRK